MVPAWQPERLRVADDDLGPAPGRVTAVIDVTQTLGARSVHLQLQSRFSESPGLKNASSVKLSALSHG